MSPRPSSRRRPAADLAAPPGGGFHPGTAPIEAYGRGGFRFAGMSHRGSLLCLPSGIAAWPVTQPAEITEATLAPLFAEAEAVDLFLIGGGTDLWVPPEHLRWRFRDHRIVVEPMSTGAAVRTYNIVLGEGRRVAAGLIAVE
jgi:uncharacterized protein